MNFKLKNYTSNVPVERTLARIETRLAEAGVSGTSRHYGPDGKIDSFIFSIKLEDRSYDVRVPVNAQSCFDAMVATHRKRHPRMRTTTQSGLHEQAYRTAWRLMEDWISVQLSFIVLRQADWRQVFLAYLWDASSQKTFYDVLQGSGFKALPERCST